ncbi:translation initiation factor eIF4e [Mycena olivaceomarginata]|nr:translation initiation factor eIF4e [Mycena olivaceomarginata]
MSNSYFSNHSAHSRFLAISASASSSSATFPPAVPPQAPNSTPTTASNAQIAGKAPGGRARSTSKHFSTSVEAHGHGEEADGAAPLPSVHPLRNTWVFWFRQQRTPGNKIVSYEDGIKRVAAFSSVESLWALTTHLAPPSALAPTTDYLLFHAAVQRPVWEDPLNITGGKWIIRLRKGVADRVWEALVCAVAGEAFAGCGAPAADEGARESWEDDDSHAEAGGEGTDDAPEICGCTISVRQSEDIISLWNRVDDVRVRERIRDTLRTVLGLPAATVMEYKSNNDSMQDKSSFRNSAIDRVPGAGAGVV